MRGIVKLGLKPYAIIWFWSIRWQKHNQLLSWIELVEETAEMDAMR